MKCFLILVALAFCVYGCPNGKSTEEVKPAEKVEQLQEEVKEAVADKKEEKAEEKLEKKEEKKD
ncbi:hypothetical protein KAR91_80165 [Candidatus Pacearchaeota archaeon]|nr:hypothetical protein [Candidatus Pacearchaeota archaeon]